MTEIAFQADIMLLYLTLFAHHDSSCIIDI
jgi:hypothetical protein